MRVRKIMNWPLTLFTLFAIGMIGVFGMGLAQTAFMNEWGRQHIEYDKAVATVKNNLLIDYLNRIDKAEGFSAIIRNGACETDEELFAMMNSAISQGEWDYYGFVGGRRVAFDNDGAMLGIVDTIAVCDALDAMDNTGVYVAEVSGVDYMFFIQVAYDKVSPEKMFFAVSMNSMLSKACNQSIIKKNPLYILDRNHQVIASVNGNDNFDYDKLTDADFYHNDAGTLNDEFLNDLKKNYWNSETALSVSYQTVDENGKQHVYSSTVPIDENSNMVITDNNQNIGAQVIYPTETTGSVVTGDGAKRVMFGNVDLNSYTVELADSYLWYANKFQYGMHLPMMTLMSGKPKVMNGDMLRQTIYILMIYMMVMVFLGIMFFIQILFTLHSNRKLVKLAYFDPVTKCKNWNRFLLDGKKILKRHKTRKYAMVLYDISRFNVYNDLYGHADGDVLLSQTAKILYKHLRKKEICARFGADHFVLLLYWDTEDELDMRILSIKKELEKVFEARSVHFTVGVYKILDYSLSIDRIYTYTTIAQENARNHSDIEIAYFSDEQRKKMLREKELENCMMDALKKREFKVYLQPKYYSDGSKIGGAEALVRWISEDKGFICPGDFIPLFEKNGFIIPLDNYMVDAVCVLQRKWLDEGKDLLTISVNISRVHLMDKNLVKDVVSIVDHYRLPHSCIELELTESAFFDAKSVLIDTIHQFREAGFEVSMDDFGSGYSSLNSLKDLNLDVIKLDGEFFKETEDTMRSTTIVTDTIQLAKHLNMRIVAEGIEKKEQVEFLNNIGCDLIQGYYFAKPMPTDQFEELLNQSK